MTVPTQTFEEAAVYCWRDVNWRAFGGSLHRPRFQVSPQWPHAASWTPGRRLITLDPVLFDDPTGGELAGVLCHEMVHQWCTQYRVAGSALHWLGFVDKCREIGAVLGYERCTDGNAQRWPFTADWRARLRARQARARSVADAVVSSAAATTAFARS